MVADIVPALLKWIISVIIDTRFTNLVSSYPLTSDLDQGLRASYPNLEETDKQISKRTGFGEYV